MSLAHTHNGADLGKDPVRRLLFQLALPSILAQLINLLYNLVDRMYIGHIPDVGATALTGVGVTMPLILCISAFAALVSMGGAPRASILLGKGEKDQAEQVLGNCTTMLVITALVLTVVVQVFGPDLLLFFGASQATLPYAWDYTRIYAMGTLFVQLALGLNAFINAQGFARTGMLTVALGVSPFIMQFTESILNVCFNTSLLQYGGDLAVGAMTILASVMQFAMLPLQGFTQGAQPIVGFNYGAGNRDRVKETFRRLLVCCIVYAGIIWAVAMFLPQVFTAIFTNDPTLAEYTQWAIRIYLALAFLMGIQVACQQTFIALGNAKTSVFLALLRKVILLIPLIYLLPHLLPGNQVMAVFLAEPVADAIAVATTGTLFWRQYHKL